MRARDFPLQALAMARGRLFPFAPVFLAIGIGAYFALPREPVALEWLALGAAAALMAGLWRRGPEDWQPLAAALCLAVMGTLLGGLRSHMVAAPVLGWHYYGAIEGRVVMIDRAGSDAVRLTLDRVVLERIAPARTPQRVRVSLHGPQGFTDLLPGKRVILTGHLSPPGGAVEPGGFEFRRLAWFQRLGAVGYTQSPVLAFAPPESGDSVQAITTLRMTISHAVQSRIPGEPGAFAAAILTGDRSGISQATQTDLRGSNLAHLLAISGLHMGLLTGFVFAALRYGLALIPPLALRLPVKKIAAAVALGAAAFYLMLSGGNVATQRAFIMVSVLLVAVLADRRAISLRSVAIAALIILVLRPESVTEAGFQMSFAATIALVAVFGGLRDLGETTHRYPFWLRGIAGLVICSVVAGLATAPIAAANFNRLAEYGLLANILAVPLMGSVVIPAAVFAALLSPLGLEGLPLRVMELGTRWILWVAEWVAGLDGAVVPVVRPAAWVLPVMALGALWLMLWPGRARWAGPVVVAVALIGWAGTQRPQLLIADTGTLIGLMTADGRVISKASGERYASENWLEADGDAASADQAHARAGLEGAAGTLIFDLGGIPAVHLTGRGAVARVAEYCQPGWLVILGNTYDGLPPNSCWLWDQPLLAQAEGGAVRVIDGIPVLHSTRNAAGERPWTVAGR